MLLRPGASRAFLCGLPTPAARPLRPFNGSLLRAQLASKHCTWSSRRPQLLPALAQKPITTALTRHVSTASSIYDKIDYEKEAQYAKQKLRQSPETVSLHSSTTYIFEPVDPDADTSDPDMMANIRSDLQTIRDTFSLSEVPKDAYYLGMAGVLPYLATSLGTIFASWEVQNSHNTGIGFLLNEKQATMLLHVLEPIQVGYGAVILSFLGAIHWGLEWASYGGRHARERYAVGVIAPAVAWPTLLFPVEEALICQFLAFSVLYYVDSNAGRYGRAPPWYGIYRFVLTLVVGGSIIVSLVGRSHIGEKVDHMPSPLQRVREFADPGVDAEIIEELGQETNQEASE